MIQFGWEFRLAVKFLDGLGGNEKRLTKQRKPMFPIDWVNDS